MKFLRLFGVVLGFTAMSSCSSFYDVWQGYDDIEPEEPAVVAPSQYRENRELNEAVRRATVETDYSSYSGISNIEGEQEGTYEKEKIAEIQRKSEQFKQEAASYEVIPERAPEQSSLVEEFIYAPVAVPVAGPELSTEFSVSEPADEEEFIFPDIDESSFQPAALEEQAPVSSDILEPYMPLVSTKDSVLAEEVSADETDIDFSQIQWNEAVVSEEMSSLQGVSPRPLLAGTIKYNKGSDKLSTSDIKALRKISSEYKKNRSKITVTGYAASEKNVGTDEAMALYELAEKRASRVASTLINQGVKREDITSSAEVQEGAGKSGKGNATEIHFGY